MEGRSLIDRLAEDLETKPVRAALLANPETAEVIRAAIDAAAGFAERGEPERLYTWCSAAALAVRELEQRWMQQVAECESRSLGLIRTLGGGEPDTVEYGLEMCLRSAAMYDPETTNNLLDEIEACLQ